VQRDVRVVSALRLRPLVDKAEADAFIALVHRHHDPLPIVKFSLAVEDERGGVRAIAQVGTPVARRLNDGFTFEVRRVAADGAPNACSLLYAACCRALAAMGATRVLTYTLASEGGGVAPRRRVPPRAPRPNARDDARGGNRSRQIVEQPKPPARANREPLRGGVSHDRRRG
jgi:hypothetical protein